MVKKNVTHLQILLLVFSFVFCTQLIFAEAVSAADSSNSSTGSSEVYIPSDKGLPESDIESILKNVLAWLLGIVGMVGIISFVVSGIQYLLSFGDDKRMETAKKNMYYSIIGIVVALSGYIVVKAIDAMLNGSSSF